MKINLEEFEEKLNELLQLHRKQEDLDYQIECVDMDLQGCVEQMTEEEKQKAKSLLEENGLDSDFYSL